MSELLEKLGIDWKLLSAQIVNFALLIFILHRFLYRKILDLLKNRSETIAQSLEEAKAAHENAQKIKEFGEGEIKKTKTEAARIMDEAKNLGLKAKEEILADARKETGVLLKEAESEAKKIKEQTSKEVERETAELISLAINKIAGKMVEKEKQEKMVEDTLRDLKFLK